MANPFSSRFVRTIDANRTIKDELTAAVHSQSARRRIAVTDLVSLRQAFFRWTHPEISPSPDRAQTMLAGTGFHTLFGQAISSEEFVEQFVEFEGIVGKIDIYEAVPLELKTTVSIPEGIGAARPGYIDQLGMYCTMTGVAAGRLLVYRRQTYGQHPQLRAFHVQFGDLAGIRTEMLRRRDLFRDALDRSDPTALPRCEWADRGCDYAGICGCEHAVPSAGVVPAGTATVAPAPELEAALASALPGSAGPPRGFRLNDLVFPRKAAFQRQRVATEEDEDEAVESKLRDLERRGFRGALDKALRFGIPGAFARHPVKLRGLSDRTGSFRGKPTLFRTTRFRTMVDRNRLPYEMGHYFDRLAFECALTPSDQGRLVLYYEVLPGEKFMVYDVSFTDLAGIQVEADRRLQLLESNAPPNMLPPCPSWMAKWCEFAPTCGCGNPPTPEGPEGKPADPGELAQ